MGLLNARYLRQTWRVTLMKRFDGRAAVNEGISYFTTKTFDKALKDAFLSGGQPRKKRDRVKVVLGSLTDPDPFVTLKVTDHGLHPVPKTPS